MIDVRVGVWQPVSGATWRQVGILDQWSSQSVDFRHLQPGAWSLSQPYRAEALPVTKTSLLTFDVRAERFTGLVDHFGYSSDLQGKPVLDLSGVDAMAYLGDALCYPDPASALNAQTTDYYTATGAAENVLTDVINANIVRLGLPMTVAPSQGRGSTVNLHERFTNLLQLVTTKCDIAGLGVRVALKSDNPASTLATLTCEFYVPRDQSNRVKLSSKAGTLRSWAQYDDAPTATRMLEAGGGKGTARVIHLVTDADAEAEWGRKREVFADARDTSDTTILNERGQSDLANAAEQSSFSLEAAEAEGMRFSDHFVVSDSVTITLMTGVSKVDRINSIVISGDSNGSSIQVAPGNPDSGNPLFAQAAITRGIRRSVRGLQQEES